MQPCVPTPHLNCVARSGWREWSNFIVTNALAAVLFGWLQGLDLLPFCLGDFFVVARLSTSGFGLVCSITLSAPFVQSVIWVENRVGPAHSSHARGKR